ncbi:MAG: ABC transporter permease subunit [Gorillibacterium sp.]|nr:ABC transporter permease subunit [Gorillibacterium sp.]
MNMNRWQPRKYLAQTNDIKPEITRSVPHGSFDRAQPSYIDHEAAAEQHLKGTISTLIMKLKKFPKSYLLAWHFLVVLVLIALLGTTLMPHPIDDSQKFTFLEKVVHGEKTYLTPPLKQDASHWFGTDHRGIDVFSLLLNGMKYTLGFTLAVVISRFLIGIPLGLLGGSHRVIGRGVQILQLSTASVPAILLLLPVLLTFYNLLYMDALLPGDEWKRAFFSLLMFICLTFVGIAPIARQISDRTRFYMSKEFVKAARTLGASRRRITWRHILPNLRAEILFIFLTELVQVMFLLGQLAVLGVFLGGANIINLEDGMPAVKISPSGEWCAMIAYGSRYIQFHPQILLGTAIFFTLTIIILKFFLSELQKLHMPVKSK